jgi:hypothetical protein
LSPAAKAKAKARAKAAGRPYPNMVDNIWAARNEEMTNEGIIGDAVKGAIAQTLTKQGGTIGDSIAKKLLKKKKTNEETAIETKPKLKDKTVKREIASIPQKTMDPMSESRKEMIKKIKKVLK